MCEQFITQLLITDCIQLVVCTTHHLVIAVMFIGSRALALADPYCHIAWNSVGLFVCVFVGPQL